MHGGRIGVDRFEVADHFEKVKYQGKYPIMTLTRNRPFIALFGLLVFSPNFRINGASHTASSVSLGSTEKKIVIETDEAQITYYRGSAFDQYKGGKQYGMLTLHNKKVIIGFLESKKDFVQVYDNLDYSRVNLNEVADICWLNQVMVKRMSGDIIVGHLIQDDSQQVIVETLNYPKTIVAISPGDIESKTIVKNAEYAKKRVSKPRVAFLGGALFAMGTFKDLFKNGTILGLSFQQNFSRVFNTESYWFPDLRVDLSGISFQNNGFNYQGAYVNAGPMWILNGVFEHKGIISIGFLPGIAYERASSPFLPDGASSYTFTFQGALSYEYPIWRRLYVGLDLRSLYSLDSNNPLTAAGVALRTSYQF